MSAAVTRPFAVAAVIPCLDAEATIADVVRRARALPDLARVLVVDDGSTDRTREAARDAGAAVVRHPRNLGKGAALATGLAEAAALGATHMATLDADGQHDPAELVRLLEVARSDPWALVIGARDFSVPHVPGASKFGRRFSNFWVWLETGARLADTQSGLRVYPVNATRALGLRPSRFEWEVEVIVRALWAALPIREVPVSVYYPPPEARTSHYRGFADSLLISLLHCRLVPRSMLRPVWRPRRLRPLP